MREKLDPEEWRPLLASSLIYEARLKIRRELATVLAFSPLIIDGLGWLELFTLAGISVPWLIILLVGLFPALFLSWFLAQWFSRRLRLGADILAAGHVGRDTLRRVLEKMKTLGLVDQYAGLNWDSYPWSGEIMRGRPTLDVRIRNLNRTQASSWES